MACVEIKPGHKENFEELIEHYSMASRQEPGCLRFDVLEDEENIYRFYTYRVFADRNQLMAHKEFEPYKEWDNYKATSGVILLDKKQMMRPKLF